MDTLFLFIVLAVACIFYVIANYDDDESYLDDVANDAIDAKQTNNIIDDDYEWRE